MTARIINADCMDAMREINADSIDAIVCDPPYELGFMGKRWDSSGIAFQPETWAIALRVAKPGTHLLAFGGDHVIPVSRGGSDTVDNLQTLCFGCNSAKRDRLVEAS